MQKLLQHCGTISDQLFASFEKELERNFDANESFSNFESRAMKHFGFRNKEMLNNYLDERLKNDRAQTKNALR